ncbi:type I restriction endonuclease subunit R [Rosistilla oblonga]|uniref:type I restriction endonuclease subunit R n=1 Tax=Rosistilla oblonga TaxID=2527990 RepID=UPI0018D26201|nr:type I restriction endonuclease subunit R [Rosistilla oblonga]
MEQLICDSLVNDSEYLAGTPQDYDREHAIDVPKLLAFLKSSQPQAYATLNIDAEGAARRKFLHRLQGEVGRRGVVDVLRNGIEHGVSTGALDLFYGTPTPGNERAATLHAKNIFSVTRQLKYSRNATARSLDFVIFINGLPLATFELKNQITKQTYDDAINQFKTDRDPRELLFQFPRCMVHFAVDDSQAWMCTHLKGVDSWFLPFNQGFKDGAGNPANPNGLRTDYLWKEILSKPILAEIIENYAQVIEEKDEAGKTKRKQIFPRYHQLKCVRGLLDDAQQIGPGKRYLIQHSAGSGKSNSITWLAHQLIGLKKDGESVFDSILVVTDRVNLDKQIRANIRQFAQESAVVGAAQNSADLRRFIEEGKKIITTTVQKFPFILDAIGDGHRASTFALIIDEAHSSQGGKAAASANVALSGKSKSADVGASDLVAEKSFGVGNVIGRRDADTEYAVAGSEDEDAEEPTTEDKINEIIAKRKMLSNASYFAFTATPKPKTLELFGVPVPEGDKQKFRPFDKYTMKQAIEEGFILDVLKNYTTANSYYRLVKSVEDDPEFDVSKAKKKLRKYVESHEHAIRRKAHEMIDHFHSQVLAKKKVGGQARAMVVASSVDRAMQYKVAFDAYLKERKSPYRAIVAFSGDREFQGEKGVTESKMNGFASSKIEKMLRTDPYRFLIVADKFQTGFDEPLLHTMYVDKPLSGIRAVQTLSRLNRAHPHKYDTFVLDFLNDLETIRESFAKYYRTTVLSDSTDPNKLHDLKSVLDAHQVYAWSEVQAFVDDYLAGADRSELDPLLDVCVDRYLSDLDEDKQVDFKSRAKAFVRTYGFLATILPSVPPNWERLSTFLNFLTPKLPAPQEEDLSKGILQTIDMDSYRVEVGAQMQILLPDEDAEVDPANDTGGGAKPPVELDRLSSIIRTFNDQFGNIDWDDKDRIEELITEEIPRRVAEDPAYNNACQNSDKKTARIEHDRAYRRVMNSMIQDQTKLYKHYNDEEGFRQFAHDTSFDQSYEGKRDRLGPVYDLLLSHFQKTTGVNVSSRWNQHAGDFQRSVHNLKSLVSWIKSARILCVDEQSLVPSSFGNIDVAMAVRVIDDRLAGRRGSRYRIERILCKGAGVQSLEKIDDESSNRVQTWMVKEIHHALRESAATRGRLSLDQWKCSLTTNDWQHDLGVQLADAVQRFRESHDRLVGGGDGPSVFRESSRTEMAKSIGAIQTPTESTQTDSDAIWQELFAFAERVIKLTSESLTIQDGGTAHDALVEFKRQLGKSSSAALDLLFQLRCRGDHADDVAKRGEWEQIQHAIAKQLGREKPKFNSDSELLYRPDDLQLTATEANEIRVKLLDSLSDGLETIVNLVP